jgi:predicted O-linked N-acetylglucosamine transferase (SPINDLY family)
MKPAADATAMLAEAVALHRQGRFAEALAGYDRALAIAPEHADALVGRGNALRALGRHDEALASFARAIAMGPDSANAFNCHGVCLQELGRHEEALASYGRALALDPNYAQALNNRGNALQGADRCEDALADYQRALALNPDYAAAWNNRGACLQRFTRHAEALASYERALAATPDYAEAWCNRGGALHELRRYEDAIASHDRALLLRPDYADARCGRGNALRNLLRHDEAAEEYAKLLRIAPAYPLARGLMFDSRVQCCDWRGFDGDAAAIASEVQAAKLCVTPFAFLTVSDSAVAQLRCARTYAGARYPAAPPAVFSGGKSAHEKIRVAYVSGDFKQHAVSFLLAGVFERHDRSRFDTIAISFGPGDASAVGLRVNNAFGRFIYVSGNTDSEAAQLMRGLEIDIAVDLMGFTGDNRTAIFAHRAAPVQVSYLGFPGTMGAPYLDYLLADRYLIPAEHEAAYAEHVVCLPDTFQANDAKREIAERTPTRVEAGLPESGFVFCCFNNGYKITPQLFGVWMRLLAKVEGSVLWLVKDRESAEDNLRNEAAARGVDPQRLVFAPRLPYPEHLARYRLADLFLDTRPFNAGATASDALWAGLPLLTCSGEAYAARMAGSLLQAIGLPELVTHTLEDYEALALMLATDAGLLEGIKLKLAQNRSTHPLFDTERFTRHLESAYLTMWERDQCGEHPAGFAVEAIGERIPELPDKLP